MPMTLQLKAPNKAIKYAFDFGSKLLNGMDGTEKDFKNILLTPIYIDYDNQEYDIKECVYSLITYILGKTDTHFGISWTHTLNPYGQFVDANRKNLCGFVGSMMTEKEGINVMMKFTGIDNEKIDLIRNNPLSVKLPQILCS